MVWGRGGGSGIHLDGFALMGVSDGIFLRMARPPETAPGRPGIGRNAVQGADGCKTKSNDDNVKRRVSSQVAQSEHIHGWPFPSLLPLPPFPPSLPPASFHLCPCLCCLFSQWTIKLEGRDEIERKKERKKKKDFPSERRKPSMMSTGVCYTHINTHTHTRTFALWGRDDVENCR